MPRIINHSSSVLVIYFPLSIFFPSYSCLLLHAVTVAQTATLIPKLFTVTGTVGFGWSMAESMVISYTLHHYTALTLTRDHAIVLVLRVTYTDTLHHVCVVR